MGPTKRAIALGLVGETCSVQVAPRPGVGSVCHVLPASCETPRLVGPVLRTPPAVPQTYRVVGATSEKANVSPKEGPTFVQPAPMGTCQTVGDAAGSVAERGPTAT